MDSILEFEQREIDAMVEVLAGAKDTFKTHAADLFEDAFLVLTSAGAKVDNFKILRQLQSVSQDEAGEITEEVQQQLASLFDVVLNICAQVFRMGVKGQDEFQLVLDDIGLKGNKGAAVQQAFLNSFIQRLDLTNNI